MGTYDATVRRCSVKKEHCVAHQGDLDSIGSGVFQQVRLWRSPDRAALFTVGAASMGTPGEVGLGPGGRERLLGGDGFTVTVDAQVVDPRRTSEEAEVDGEFVERLVVGRSRTLAIIAPHGGAIEAHTDTQAGRLARRLGAVAPWVWVCKGWALDEDAYDRWHITSTDLSPESFPRLKRMMRKPFTHAISFHGFDRDSGADVHIGGRAKDTFKALVREKVQEALRDKGWDVVVDGENDPFPACTPRNIVNRLAPDTGGLQLEQSLRARRHRGAAIADAVAFAYGSLFASPAEDDGASGQATVTAT